MRRPLLRYYGGKYRLAPWIISHFPPHITYVEPYGGGGSVLLRKPRSKMEIYNDLDGEVCNVFKMTRDRGKELARLLSLTPYSREEFLESYEHSDDPLERARRYIVRSFMGHGSDSATRGTRTGFKLCRGRPGTRPAHEWKTFPEALRNIVGRLQGVVIENKDSLAVMKYFDSPTTLFYCDPPYQFSTRSELNNGRKHGYSHEMEDEDHRKFAEIVKGLMGMVIVSGYPNIIYDEILGDWAVAVKRAHKNIGYGDECLWISPSALGGFDLFAPSIGSVGRVMQGVTGGGR